MTVIETTYDSGLAAEPNQPVQDQVVASILLGTAPRQPPLGLVALGISIYAATLTAALTINFELPPLVLEAPMDMVYEEPAKQEPEQPPPPPPEPVAEPLDQPEKPPEVKEQPKPPPPPPQPASRTRVPGAVMTDYANKVYYRIARVAGGGYPRSALARGQSVRIAYSIVIGSSGELISKSIGNSGIAALDLAIAEALTRSAPFPAPPALGARSYKISGAIVYRAQ